MTLFEFILVLVSLVLAIGITHLLREVSAIVRHRADLRLHWIPLTWLASLFIGSALYWWSLWDFRAVEWTFPTFFYLLLAPTFLYIAYSLVSFADFAVPGISMRERFEHVRVPFMVVMGVYTALSAWDGWVFGVEPLWNSLRFVQVGVVGAFLLGAATRATVVQALVVIVVFMLYVFGAFVLRYLPGAFNP